MRSIWTALAVLLAAAVAFVASWIAAFIIGIDETGDSQCDGPCFDRWDEVAYVAFGVAGLCAIVAGYFTWRFIRKRWGPRSS